MVAAVIIVPFVLNACNAEDDAGQASSAGAPLVGGGSVDAGLDDALVTAGDVDGSLDATGSDPAGEGPCSACADNETCVEDVCLAEGCPPTEPYGVMAGDNLTDVVVYDCEGEPVNVHSLCGANVAYFNLLAGW